MSAQLNTTYFNKLTNRAVEVVGIRKVGVGTTVTYRVLGSQGTRLKSGKVFLRLYSLTEKEIVNETYNERVSRDSLLKET